MLIKYVLWPLTVELSQVVEVAVPYVHGVRSEPTVRELIVKTITVAVTVAGSWGAVAGLSVVGVGVGYAVAAPVLVGEGVAVVVGGDHG